MKRYEVRDEQWATKIIEAENITEALAKAEKWAQAGEYEERTEVWIEVYEIDAGGVRVDGGECDTSTVEAGPETVPPETDCGDSDDDHKWVRPVEAVGGCTQNPGVFSLGGTTMAFVSICSRCGIRKTRIDYGVQKNPGDVDHTKYEEPDADTLAWIAQNKRR
jgi:hypothetical protein